VLRRLQKLYHHGYLDRPSCQVNYFQSGSQAIAYTIGYKGAAWLKRKLALPYHQIHWIRKESVGRYFLQHALLISEVMVAFEIACRDNPNVKLLLPNDRRLYRWGVSVDRNVKCGVIPDAVFALERNGKNYWYCLEADRSTMPVKRATLRSSSFLRKLFAYQSTWNQNIHRKRFNWSRFRVLTVTTEPKRVQKIIEASRKLKSGHGLFMFRDIKTLLSPTPSSILSSSWYTPRDGQLAGLFD